MSTSQEEWLVEGLVPRGALMVIADVADGSPEEVLARGYDVVMHLSEVNLGAEPVRMTVLWRPGLVPGRRPPAPFWVALIPGAGLVRVDPPDGEAAS